MSSYGFYITQLSLSGEGLDEATVDFEDGLNVITGPSDTGKTYIAQCIDFMFGGSKKPEPIPESQGYESAALSLRSREDGRDYTLKRSLRGGAFSLTSPDRAEVVLGESHDKDNDATASGFLLDLSGLAGQFIRTNARGTTRKISFRDVARLIIVDEETIISKRSPVVTGQYTTRTAERNLFRLLLTGVDDSTVQESPDQKLAKQREGGKSEILDKVRSGLLERIKTLGIEGTSEVLQDQLEKLDLHIKSVGDELASEQRSATELEDARRISWSELRRIESRQAVIEELQARFTLLDEQYASDLRRLESTAEAGFRLSQLNEERCPVCGALPEHHDAEHNQETASPEVVAAASQAEADRTRHLVSDLVVAQRDNREELEALHEQRNELRTALSRISQQLEEEAKPRLQERVQELRDGQEKRSALIRIIELHEQLAELEKLSTDSDKNVEKTAAVTSAAISISEAEEFSKEVEALLESWHFPDLDRVVFSEADQDIAISGRSRASHGKGVRAITHAAFNIGLADYCANRDMPHPGVVVLDSPLVVYREPDDDEGEFSTEVKDLFYRSLATRTIAVQSIVLENDIPPSGVEDEANVIKFTGGATGRQGFIPPRREVSGAG